MTTDGAAARSWVSSFGVGRGACPQRPQERRMTKELLMTTRLIRLGALLIAALVATGATAEPIAASMTIERKVVVDWAAIAEHGDWNLCGDAQGRIIYCGGGAGPADGGRQP